MRFGMPNVAVAVLLDLTFFWHSLGHIGEALRREPQASLEGLLHCWLTQLLV
jgi:hypothetical protein